MSADDLARARQPLERGWTLPPAAYTDPRIFDVEKQAIFGRDWICVARREQLATAGDYLCVDLPDQPIVVTRDYQGILHAQSRICLHRAMPVAAGSGNASRFVCPYHNWTYELDGQLRSAPMMDSTEDFDPTRCRLPALKLEEWQGFVFVNRDPGAAPLAPQLTGLAELIERYDYADLEVAATTRFDSPWNWKVLVENFMEAYHHIGTHRHTFEPVFPARDSEVPDNGAAPWTFLRMPARPGTPEAEQVLFPRLEGAERQQLLAMNVYPSLLFAASPSGGVWYQLEPRAHDRMTLTIHYLLPAEEAGSITDQEREEIIAAVRMIHLEDIEANEGPWQGLQAALTTQGRLSTCEKAIWQLNQLWLARMGSLLGVADCG